jgi:amino acid adenylation domain-containing protein
MMAMSERSISAELSFSAAQNVRERDYWLAQLSGQWVKSRFPYDYRKTVDAAEGTEGVRAFRFPPEVSSPLIKISGGADTRLHMILVAAVTALLGRCTDSGDIVVGTPIYKQDTDTPGRFVNTVLVLRNPLTPRMTFKELILQVRETVAQAVAHQNYPLEALLYQLKLPVADDGDFPLFDVAVLLENIHDKAYLRDTRLNACFSFLKRGRCLEGRLHYNTGRYKVATIDSIVHRLSLLLRQCLTDIDVELAALCLMTEAEKRQVLVAFNRSQCSYGRDRTIVELFEEQVEKTPHRLALKARQKGAAAGRLISLTYRQLNSQANRLANRLRQRGVLPGTIVALMVDRSPHMAAAVLAVLKAGGAYLPLDPDMPVQRIAAVLDDCRAPLLVMQADFSADHSFTMLQGLRTADVMPQVSPPRPPIAPLDELPVPDRSLVDYGQYNRYIGQAMAKNVLTIQASRGCPYNCAYCHKIWPKKHLFRSAPHIYREVKHLYDLGVRKFAFVDDIFNLDRKNSSRFFQMIVRNGLEVAFYFPNGLRGDLLTEEYIDLMVEAGTVSLALALETASPRLQKLIGKNLDLQKFRRAIEYLCRQYPNVILELFTMHGFPGETEAEARMTLDFIKSLHWVHFPYINVLKIYPHTDMEKLALVHGISRESIIRSEYSPHFELSDNLPFDKNFSLAYRSDFLDNYFLCKERLLKLLPFQMKVMTRDEMIQKYNSYLPTTITGFDELLESIGVTAGELGVEGFGAPEVVSDFSVRVRESSRRLGPEPDATALRVLLLDLSQFFSTDKSAEFFYDVVGEAPLGLMYLLTYLNRSLGSGIKGRIAKSRIDFDSFGELLALLEEFDPQVIGVRSLHIYQDFFHQTLARIRQWGFTVPIIAGGPYASTDYTSALRDRNVDLVVLGEGEATFHEVIEKIIQNGGQLPGPAVLKEIPGIAFIPGQDHPGSRVRDILFIDAAGPPPSPTPGKDSNPPPVNRAHDPAYCITTSGSTGRSKGVLLEHRNIHYLLAGLKRRVYDATDGFKNIGLLAPYVFDASVKQIFLALLQGHTLHIVPAETRLDGLGILEFFRQHRIDICDATPTHLRLLLESMKTPDRSIRRLPGPLLPHLLIGGEALLPETVKALWACFPQGKELPPLTNVYGPTECCVDAAAFDVAGGDIDEYQTIPIGTPLPNARLYILDRQRQPQPPGLPGELYIAGDGLARGYLNNPELTAEKFIHVAAKAREDTRSPNDYILTPKSYILYRTGDLCRFLPDGNIEFLGRCDHQVKIRGYRIELGEIETWLLKHPAVKEGAVLVRQDSGGDQYLCAYFVPRPFADLSVPRLREYLASHLPAYSIPSFFVELAQMPLTAAGKIHRQALPEPSMGEAGQAYQSPQDETQRRLADLWAEILGIDRQRIGAAANFFEIGGHSLKATILIARIHKIFDVQVPLAAIFKDPTLKGVARLIGGSAKSRFFDLHREEEKEYYPLSFNQKRLWVLNQLEPQSPVFNMPGSMEFNYPVDETLITSTLRRLVRRHESFRTGFKMVNHEPVQFIAPEVDIPFRTIDISPLPGAEKQRRRDEIFKKEAETPFDLSRPPIFRSLLIKLEEDRFQWIYNCHHIVTDGWSNAILRQEFSRLYEGLRAGEEVGLEPLRLQYRDFARWHHKRLNDGEQCRESHRYWRQKLENGFPTFQLPADFSGSRALRVGAGYRFPIDGELSARIKKLAQAHQTTLFTVMLAAYILLLYRFSHQCDVVCSIINAGREHLGLHRLMGFFVNAVPFRTDVAVEEPFADLLDRLNNEILEAFRHQGYPLELVAEELKIRYPDISVSFNMGNMQDATAGTAIEDFTAHHVDHVQDVKFDMEPYLIEYRDGIDLFWSYKKRLFKPTTIGYMVQQYVNMLDFFTLNPGSSYQAFAAKGKIKII